MKRPFGFSILALLFAWLSVAGFGYAVAATRLTLPQGGLQLSRPMMILTGSAYGVTALASCVGLWLGRAWSPRAILCWGVVVLLGMATFQGMIGVRGEPWWLVVLPYLLLSAIAALIYRYVARQFQSVAPAI